MTTFVALVLIGAAVSFVCRRPLLVLGALVWGVVIYGVVS